MATFAAIRFMVDNKIDENVLLARHIMGDWGDLSDDDKKENDFSVKNGYRILSSYKFPAGKIWLITEADRSATTFLLPEDY